MMLWLTENNIQYTHKFSEAISAIYKVFNYVNIYLHEKTYDSNVWVTVQIPDMFIDHIHKVFNMD